MNQRKISSLATVYDILIIITIMDFILRKRLRNECLNAEKEPGKAMLHLMTFNNNSLTKITNLTKMINSKNNTY